MPLADTFLAAFPEVSDNYNCNFQYENMTELTAGIMKRHGFSIATKIQEAFQSVDRRFYLNTCPYDDVPKPPGEGATNAPHMALFGLQSLQSKLVPGSRILDVGSGPGLLSVAFASLLEVDSNSNSVVVGIDIVDELVNMSIDNVQRDKGNSHLWKVAGGTRFVFQHANAWTYNYTTSPVTKTGKQEFDGIHVAGGVEYPSSIPKSLGDALAEGGSMIIPLGPKGAQQMYTVTKSGGRLSKCNMHLAVSYVMLAPPGGDKQTTRVTDAHECSR